MEEQQELAGGSKRKDPPSPGGSSPGRAPSAPAPKKQRMGIAAWPKKPVMLPTNDDISSASGVSRQDKDPITVRLEPSLRNLHRIRQALQGKGRGSIADAEATISAHSRTIDVIWDCPPLKESEYGVWKVLALGRPGDGKNPGFRVFLKHTPSKATYVLRLRGAYTREESKTIGQHMVHVLERWPYPLPCGTAAANSTSPGTMETLQNTGLLDLAVSKAFPHWNKPLIYPKWGGLRTAKVLFLEVDAIDPATGLPYKYRHTPSSGDWTGTDEQLVRASIPEVPVGFDFYKQPPNIGLRTTWKGQVFMTTAADGTTEWDSVVPQDLEDEQRIRFLAVEKFLRFASWKLSNKVASRDEMILLTQSCYEECGLTEKVKGTIEVQNRQRKQAREAAKLAEEEALEQAQKLAEVDYAIEAPGEGRMKPRAAASTTPPPYLFGWFFSTSDGAHRIVHGTSALHAFTLKQVAIIVNSPNALRLWSPLHTLRKTFSETGSVNEAFLATAEDADHVNEDIAQRIPPRFQHEYAASTGTMELLPCMTCLDIVDRNTLKLSAFGLFDCEECIELYDEKRKQQLSDSLKVKIKRGCRVKWQDERSVEEGDEEVEAEILDKMWKDLEPQVPEDGNGLIYLDSYAGNMRRELPGKDNIEERYHYRGPLLPSVEAGLPYFDAGGHYRTHCKGNVYMTPLALNRAKYTHLPKVLALISKHYAQVGDNALPIEDDKNIILLTACTESTRIQVKIPLKRAARKKAKFDKRRWQLDQQEMVSGKPVEEPGPWQNELPYLHKGTEPMFGSRSWDNDTSKRLHKLSREIQARFNVDLVEGADGAPWIAHPKSMPQNWSFSDWAKLCSSKEYVMKSQCNKYWPQVDTEQSLFAEIIYQVCSDEPKYREFLNLPLSIEIHNPLNLSIAHEVHTQQLNSPWRPYPATLADRGPSETGNMLIETQFSNLLKWDYDPAFYGHLRQIIREIKIPKKLYDSTLPRVTEVDEAAQNITEPESLFMETPDEVVDEENPPPKRGPRGLLGHIPILPDQPEESDTLVHRIVQKLGTSTSASTPLPPSTTQTWKTAPVPAGGRPGTPEAPEIESMSSPQKVNLQDKARDVRRKIREQHSEAFDSDPGVIRLLAQIQDLADLDEGDTMQASIDELLQRVSP